MRLTKHFTPPVITKEFHLNGQIVPRGNPVMNWMKARSNDKRICVHYLSKQGNYQEKKTIDPQPEPQLQNAQLNNIVQGEEIARVPENEVIQNLNLREIEENRIGTIGNNINFSARRAQVLNCTQIVDEHSVGSRFSQQGLPIFQCQHCAAIKWPLEASTMCCNNGKIRTAIFPEPPNEIKDLWLGTSEESRIFRENSRILNNALTLAS